MLHRRRAVFAKGPDEAMSVRRSAPSGSLAWPLLVLAAFILVSAGLRPVLPPDETRYLTVAWEMLVNRDFVVPTVNFAPYHHKPPLLFWLIDIAWALFGVSRLSALVVVFAISALSIVLTRQLARELVPNDDRMIERIGWAMLGNAVFVIYSGLILFDLLLTCCVLGAVIALLAYAREGGRGRSNALILLAGLCLGLGVLAKGPVVLVFLLWPVATYPLWRGAIHAAPTTRMWRGFGLSILVGLLLVAAWIVPALIETHGEFASSLIWSQTAGRISGNLANSHDRPFWFYLPLLPIFAMPWIFSPYLWSAHRASLARPLRSMRRAWQDVWWFRFLVLWTLPVVATFSLIGGKQPHYLVPLLPAVVIAAAALMRTLRLTLIRIGAAIVLALAVIGQGAAALTVFKGYDTAPLAVLVASHDGPVAFLGDYQGDFGFLARLQTPLTVLGQRKAASNWLAANPTGLLVAVWLDPGEPLPGRVVFDAPYELDRRMAASVAAGGQSGEAVSKAKAQPADRTR